MHDTHQLLEARFSRVLKERVRPAEHEVLSPLSIAAFAVTDPNGVEGQGEPISFQQAMEGDFVPFEVEQSWGPAWGTTWFRFQVRLPEDTEGLE